MKDQTEVTIRRAIDYMNSLSHVEAVKFANEMAYAVSIEAGTDRAESIVILITAMQCVEDFYDNTENICDFETEKAIVEN